MKSLRSAIKKGYLACVQTFQYVVINTHKTRSYYSMMTENSITIWISARDSNWFNLNCKKKLITVGCATASSIDKAPFSLSELSRRFDLFLIKASDKKVINVKLSQITFNIVCWLVHLCSIELSRCFGEKRARVRE